MNEDAIVARARATGIAVDWTDALGQPKRVSTESLRRLLESLDGTEERAEVPPLVTAEAGERIALPNLDVEGDVAGELMLEDGSVRPVTVRAGSVAAIPQAGYHRLRFGGREIVLAVAPKRCLTLEEAGGGRRMWGVAAQIYGLRRSGDGGIGDAGALRDLAEAAARHGADAVALSPAHSLFSTWPGRHGPYSPSSRLFLNPLYADPALVFDAGRIATLPPAAAVRDDERLIDRATAGAAKLARLKALFDDFVARHLGSGSALATDFERFVVEGGETLHEHATFEALHAERPGDWAEWPADWRQPAAADAPRFHLFLQWLAARSFAAAQAGARAAGMRIGLIGDLAIGMDRAGSHAWSRQSDLLLGLAIGAPPDVFNPRGQDWGLTGFSPRALVSRGFEPFLATLRATLRHAGGVRIDHIMGLVRLWLVPRGAAASEGAYLSYPFEDLLRLLALESHRHRAVVIGEDLGTVPPGFRERLGRAGIAGMDVMWFERDGAAFKPPSQWRSDAVAMTTTHDLPTVAGWWTGDDIRTRGALGLGGEGEEAERAKDRALLWQAFTEANATRAPAPPPQQPAAAVDAALAHVAQSPSRLMLAPLEDLLGLSEQPNLPGTIDEHPNWRRRLPVAARDLFERPEVAARASIIARRRA